LVEGYGPPDHSGIGAEPFAPQAVRQHNDLVVPLDELTRQEGTAVQHRGAEHLEELLGDARGVPHLGRAAGDGEVETVGLDRGGGGERARPRHEVDRVARGDILAPDSARQVALPDSDDALDARNRQFSEQQRVGQARHRGGGADANREHEERQHGERRRLDEHPDPVGHVVHEIRVHRELTANPGSIDDGAKRAPDHPDVAVPRRPRSPRPAVAQLRFPLHPPGVTVAGRDDARRDAHEEQADAEGERIARGAGHDREGLGFQPRAFGISRGMRYRARPVASTASPSAVSS
jgi:hypothetical protein